MSSKVKKKVINFYEYIVSLYTEVEKFDVLVRVCVVLCVCVVQWQRNRGNPGVDLFHELPVAFQAELSLETYKKVIEKVGTTHTAHLSVSM